MKTKEELKKLKEEYKTLNKKLKELTDEELIQVTGGVDTERFNFFKYDSDLNPNQEYHWHFYKEEDQPEFEPKF